MIKGKKIALRALWKGDESDYCAWINDPETNVYRGLYHPTSLEEATGWIQDQSVPKPDRLTFAIEIKTSGKSSLVGFIGLRSICPRSRRAELWIYLGNKRVWRKGLGSDSISTLCAYAFEEMNLHRIWMECDPEFTAAVKCYEKVGFTEEGRLRQAYYRRGKYRDTCIMGLLRTDRKSGK